MEGPQEVRIVYVEDDKRLAAITSTYFRAHGIDARLVTRGDEAVAEVMRFKPDVVVLDLMLPGQDGLVVCKLLREQIDVPIIIVTARIDEVDRVIGLEGGADDYVTKPFSTRELVARIRAHHRRARGHVGPPRERSEVGDLIVDVATMTVTLGGKPLALTSIEFALLRALAAQPGRVLGRERLLELLHGTATDAFDRSIDVHVSRLRQKLQDDPRCPQMLKTVRNAGYMLCPRPPQT
jgi:DNA-binding response OmpR family regulator